MKFFVPCAADRAVAEQAWAGVRMWLSELGLPTTRRRIEALSLSDGHSSHLLQVGMDTPGGDPVIIILEASDADVFYVCTPWRGVVKGEPYALGRNAGWRAIDFDHEVVGHA